MNRKPQTPIGEWEFSSHDGGDDGGGGNNGGKAKIRGEDLASGDILLFFGLISPTGKG